MLVVFPKDDLVFSFVVDLKDPDPVLSRFCVEWLEIFRGFETEPGNYQISDGHQTVHPECLVVEDMAGQLLRVC